MSCIQQQLISTVKALESAGPFIALEQAVLNRLLYKFKNAHRRTVYYRKLIHVRQCLKFSDLHSEIPFLKHSSEDQSLRKDDSLIKRLNSKGCQLSKTLDVILDCSWHLFHLLKQTFFMSMALTFVSILARIFVLFKSILQSLSKTLTLFCTAPMWQQPAASHLRIAEGLISNRYSMALPNSPELSDVESDLSIHDRNDPANDEVAVDVPEVVFSQDLLEMIAALEDHSDTDEITCKENSSADSSTNLDGTCDDSGLEVENPGPIIGKNTGDQPIYKQSSVIVDNSNPIIKAKKKPSKKPKRKRDELDDIFGQLD